MEEQAMDLPEQLMRRFGELRHRKLTGIGAGDLRQGERSVLMFLRYTEHPPVRANELAGELNMTAPSLTPILNRLEDAGYIRREVDRRDRRVVHAALTEQGRAALEQDIAQMRRFFSGLANYLGEQDCGELLRLIDKTLEYYHQNYN